MMLDRFTDRALRAMRLARGEAYRRRSAVIGDVHVLAGLLAEGGGVGGKALTHQAVTLERFWHAVDEIDPPLPSANPPDPLPFTPRARQIVQEAGEAASRLGSPKIGTEHLLLSILKDREGTAARSLERLGLHLEQTRDWLLELLAWER